MKENATPPPARRWVFGAIAIGVLFAAFAVSRQMMLTAPKAERHPPERRARLVQVQAVSPSTETVSITAHGQVSASQSIVLSAQVAGVVTGLGEKFVPGQRVDKGTLLLEIDKRDYQLALENARSNLAAAQASLAQEQGSQSVARADFDLLDIEVEAAEKSLMLRRPQLRAAEAAVSSAKAAVGRAQLDLERTRIRAPFDAVVLSRNVGVGAQVSGPATSLGELAKAKPYWITLLVPVESLRWIELPSDVGKTPGSEVEIREVSQGSTRSWSGRVIQLLDAVEEQGRRARLLVEVDPTAGVPGASLLLGSYVEARIVGKQVADVFRLDAGWLHQNRVWTVREGRLVEVPLEILHRGSDAVLARGALVPGEKVVSSTLSSAVDGMKVRLPDEDPVVEAAKPEGSTP